MHALRQHALERKAKYAAWRAATLHWKRTILRAFCRFVTGTPELLFCKLKHSAISHILVFAVDQEIIAEPSPYHTWLLHADPS